MVSGAINSVLSTQEPQYHTVLSFGSPLYTFPIFCIYNHNLSYRLTLMLAMFPAADLSCIFSYRSHLASTCMSQKWAAVSQVYATSSATLNCFAILVTSASSSILLASIVLTLPAREKSSLVWSSASPIPRRSRYLEGTSLCRSFWKRSFSACNVRQCLLTIVDYQDNHLQMTWVILNLACNPDLTN